MVASPLHVLRNRCRIGVRLAVVDTVAAPAWPALPGDRQRRGWGNRLRAGRVRRLAGALHAFEGVQPGGAAVGVANPGGRRHRRAGPRDHLVPRVAGRRPRLHGGAAAALLGPSPDRGAGAALPVRFRRDRPADRQIGALPGPSVGSRGTAAGVGGGRRRVAVSRDRCAAQRRRRARRDGLSEQVVRKGQRRTRPRQPRSQ